MSNYVKTPTVFQMEATECGAASLAMIFSYWGHYLPLEQMRLETGVSRDGCNAKNIMVAAQKYGLETHGYMKELDAMLELKPPCILHWNFNHFVVYEGRKGDYYYLNDPALGHRRLTKQELDDGYTGIVLTFKPTESFERVRRPHSFWYFVANRLQGQKPAVAMLCLVGLLLAIPGIVVPVFSQVFVDEILLAGNTDWTTSLLVAMGGTVLFQGCLHLYRQFLLARLQNKMALVSSYSFLNKMFSLPIQFFSQRLPGELAGRVDNNSGVSDFIAGDLAESAINILSAAFYFAILLLYSWPLTLVGAVCVAATFIGVKKVSDSMSETAIKFQQDRGKLVGTLYSGLTISDSLKAAGTENDYVMRLQGFYSNNANMEQTLGKKQHALNSIPDAAGQITNVLMLVLGGLLVIRGDITAGMLTAYTALFGAFVEPINKLVGFVQKIQTTKADMHRVADIDNYILPPETEPRKMTDKLQGNVELKSVAFGYSRLNPPLVTDFNFTLHPGDSVAFVGSSGCGKSTVTKLISRLHAPWDGQILFDGIPQDEIPRSIFNASVSVVNQDITIFSGTIRQNITMWSDSVREEDMLRAARDACFHQVAVRKPGAYDYVLTEGGGNLSGGQRQRLEIARALATNPTILIMDEATSALDPIVEQDILNNIKRRGCTCIIVAQRLSAIRDCDEIIVMSHGKIAQRGRHEELMQQDGVYKTMIHNT